MAVERVLFQVNVRTAMSVGQASGLAMAEAVVAGCEVAQYSPNQVKKGEMLGVDEVRRLEEQALSAIIGYTVEEIGVRLGLARRAVEIGLATIGNVNLDLMYALPGQLNVGSDSHTPHVGAIGCIAFGIGTTDVFNSWITKDVRVKGPESP